MYDYIWTFRSVIFFTEHIQVRLTRLIAETETGHVAEDQKYRELLLDYTRVF